MKKLFFAITLIILTIVPVFAEEIIEETYKLQGQVEYDDNPVETIYLDDTIERPRVNIPKRTLTLPVGVLNITSNTDTPRSALARAMVNRRGVQDILPLSGSITEQAGGFSYGSNWGEEISYSQIESSASIFVRYDAPKFFSLMTDIKQSANQDIGTQYNTLRVTPEWHITDKLTIKDSFSTYMNLPKNKNEITLVYTPDLKKYADSLKFELGVAQSYYQSGRQSSAVSFTTGFKL